ncbi:D-glycero-beta-D-manno-heptose 1-phosphate adenylyltransferase [Arthrobacter sp. zg-Y1171]|uniref:D-glycero-beta-D-manno-heptose 1-phosphate adenylyltransferase n=1 Tax=Arthrobacter sp. zg-Y1171 TaxID=2964610 RepID=UPI0021062201|nr:D-glycero-beta-D-manno-heptose 1-phosphate adenylyltransferase [Arthrobacter sp. zg-Y1171]MCQ1994058.1 D-glycero-beta-D-manno-heptose 1-phosphate adenylyltransferase [Arthrobacter sp. zg-Y1171]UWX81835.1 D-glycero-beta-D-manno-heptose 1-phosphate adenylyltransferase [Arthrobacter sp. zg-Y1171]
MTDFRNPGEVRSLAPGLPDRLAAASLCIAVIGDVMLDGWWSGVTERFCREAPAPVVDVQRKNYAPGGAGNTAMNLQALGARVRLGGLTGTDAAGDRLRGILAEAGVDLRGMVRHPDAQTATKDRIVAAEQVLFRLDDGGRFPPEAEELLAASVPALLEGADALVVCDYGTGLLHGAVRDALVALRGGRLTVVDAHDAAGWAHLSPDLVTPNAAEAAQLLGGSKSLGHDRAAAVRTAAPALLAAAGAAAAAVTLDRDGAAVIGADGGFHRTWARPAAEKQASGAGDTFVACLTLARAAGLPLSTAADLAQNAADIVVQRPGTSVCSTADLEKHLDSFADTALSQADLLARTAVERAAGRRIVLTNGCFDVLHRGHTRYLNQAKQLGDILVVALNSDASARRLKGPGRPINPVHDRAGIIAALSCVDYVTVFDTDTPIPLIRELRPDIYAKGGDYSAQMLAETPVVEECGGRVLILDYVSDHSTTALVSRIRSGGTGNGPGATEGNPAGNGGSEATAGGNGPGIPP